MTTMTPTDAQIKEYWNHKAQQLGTDPSATMKDVVLRSLEIEAISERLAPDDTLLDVGCGNAFGSLTFAERCARVLAVDYSERMVFMATEAIRNNGRKNINAEQHDVTQIGTVYPGAFTAVSSVRCLINLPKEEQQYQAIGQLAQVLASRGRLFLIEGVAEHFAAMNRMREEVGLKPITLDWHNRIFSKATLESALHQYFAIEEIVDFGEYYFLSRIVNPLLAAPEEPRFDDKLNHVAKSIWQSQIGKNTFASMSTLVLYVCRKS
jgi:SAM-dependent methyltransferase